MHTSVNCAFVFCRNPITPEPSANAAESLPTSDPSQRNPNAALDDYKRRTSVETLLGIIFVLCVVCVAVGLWIGFDKELRRRLLRWGAAFKAFVINRGRTQKDATSDTTAPTSRNTGRPAVSGRGTMPLGPERVMHVMPCVAQAKHASSSSGGSTLAEKKSMEEGTEGLPVLPQTIRPVLSHTTT